MSGNFTDRDERAWQRRAEQPISEPWDIGYRIHQWIPFLRRAVPRPGPGRAPVARPRPCEPA